MHRVIIETSGANDLVILRFEAEHDAALMFALAQRADNVIAISRYNQWPNDLSKAKPVEVWTN